MIDEIESKLKGATVSEVVKLTCCVPRCAKAATHLVALRFADQTTDLYGVCRPHRVELQGKHPTKLATVKEQGVFLYS